MSYEEDEPELEAASDGWIFVQVMGNDNLEEFHFCSEDCMNAYF